MSGFDRRDEIEDPRVVEETNIDMPDVPVDQTRTVEELQTEAAIEKLVDSIRKTVPTSRTLDKAIYKKLTLDADGYLSYDHKRITSKQGKKLLSIKTLQNNVSGREFLKLLGYDQMKGRSVEERDLETVAPEQALAIKAKTDSFKVTQEWAKKEKEKAQRQLETTTNENDRQKLRESISYFEHMELQAKQRYNEVTGNQLNRVNEIISDRSRSLGERLKELFRRDGVTIGAIITAIGMTISTIVLSLLPSGLAAPASVPSGQPTPKPQNKVRQALVKVANWLLDLAKKAMLALPGALGSILGLIFKKAAQTVLFLSEHLILLFLTLALAATEFIIMKRRKTKEIQEH